MLKQAIIVTKDNVSVIADSLIDYTVQNILDETEPLLERGFKPVLVREIFDGAAVVSYIVSEQMFYANAKTATELNDWMFVQVVPL